MKKLFTYVVLFLISLQASSQELIKEPTIQKAISSLEQQYGESDLIRRGVRAVAEQWRESSGDEAAFLDFCEKQYVNDPTERYELAVLISENLMTINGHVRTINSKLSVPLSADTGVISPAERLFASFRLNVNLSDDLYKTKIPYLVLLNYPPRTDREKEELGEYWDMNVWGYTFLGDLYKKRESPRLAPRNDSKKPEFQLYQGNVSAYSSNSKVPLLSLRDRNGKELFEEDKNLLFHWRMRDEIKNIYASSSPNKLEQQKTIYKAMERNIDQSIPNQIMNEKGCAWNPFTNDLSINGAEVKPIDTENIRYEYIRNLFIRRYQNQPDSTTYFDGFFASYGLKAKDVENMFMRLLSSEELKRTGNLVKSRLGRDLEPFDVWYSGFNNRSNYDSKVLDDMIKKLYPTPEIYTDSLPNILMRLGYSKEQAEFYGSKIEAQATRSNGHASGSSLKSAPSYMRTNFLKDGLDYGGHQTGMHELGHAMQMTISTHEIDIYGRRGLPNTGASESAAFMFEFRAWQGLPGIDYNDEMYSYSVLDKFWTTMEMTGSALFEIKLWQWMYNKVDFTAAELKDAVLELSKDVWNTYYAPIFGSENQIVQASYNHMLTTSLYLPGYALAHIMHMQLEQYIQGKHFPSEVSRIYSLGRIPSELWMDKAVGEDLSVEPFLKLVDNVLDNMNQ